MTGPTTGPRTWPQGGLRETDCARQRSQTLLRVCYAPYLPEFYRYRELSQRSSAAGAIHEAMTKARRRKRSQNKSKYSRRHSGNKNPSPLLMTYVLYVAHPQRREQIITSLSLKPFTSAADRLGKRSFCQEERGWEMLISNKVRQHYQGQLVFFEEQRASRFLPECSAPA